LKNWIKHVDIDFGVLSSSEDLRASQLTGMVATFKSHDTALADPQATKVVSLVVNAADMHIRW
jgi:hypothetical protein